MSSLNKGLIFTIIALLVFIVWLQFDIKRLINAGDWAALQGNEATPSKVVAAPPKVVSTASAGVTTYSIPEDLSFGGQKIPTDRLDVQERFDREIHVNAYWKSNTVFSIKRANRWFPIIEPILKKHGIPDDMKYLAVIESSLYNSVSPSKAVGFWQILKGTAKEYGLEVNKNIDERYNPAMSAEVAARYFKRAYKKFGSWALVAASYNRGISGISRDMAAQNVDNYYDLLLNEETGRYFFRILALKELIERPEYYGFVIPEEQLYVPLEVQEITISKDIPNLVTFAQHLKMTYRDLRLYNPWIRTKKLPVKRGKTYQLSLPVTVDASLVTSFYNSSAEDLAKTATDSKTLASSQR